MPQLLPIPLPVCPRTFRRAFLHCAILLVAVSTMHRADAFIDDQPVSVDEIDFETDIRPIFANHCIQCHGPQKSESSFRVDSRRSLLAGGDYGAPVILPGDSDGSPLIPIVAGTHEDLTMPPNGNKRLTPDQIDLMRNWIDQGASMPELSDVEPAKKLINHWSLRPVSSVSVPTLDEPSATSPIDAFVLRRLLQNRLTLSPPADRRTLIRRLYLVMLGLPPSPNEVERFVQDTSDDAWASLVDHVLASPHYGERWARHWLDIARFGETDGFETNRERPYAWHYRDWVIDSLNSDKPYDQFVMEQIAGDILKEPIGTGFLVAGPHDIVKSPDINLTLMQRQDELADIVHTAGTAFLGLTLGCARCHDHKFDPVSQRDYYALQAVFAGVQHGDRPLPDHPDQTRRLEVNQRNINRLRRQLAQFVPETRSGFKFIDDTAVGQFGESGVELLVPPTGYGQNPLGTTRGFAEDPGSEQHVANISGGSYTWWENKSGVDVAAYRPQIRGRFRIWLSWGCGFKTHSQDAVYVLDRDGDLQTKRDQQVIATIDQQQFASAPSNSNQIGVEWSIDNEPLPAQPFWSGLQCVGTFALDPGSAIILRGGTTGTAITADLLVLEAVGDPSKFAASSVRESPVYRLRPAVSAQNNFEQFEPVPARYVRFTIDQTNSGIEPCLDELEIFSGETNVALASDDVRITCSGSYNGNPKHKLEHINDGRYGNDHSWISNEHGRGWVQIELPEVNNIDRIRWARDRNSQYQDRLPTQYRIEVSIDSQQWIVVASSNDRIPHDVSQSRPPKYVFDQSDSQLQSDGRRWAAELAQLNEDRKELSKKRLAYVGTFEKPPATHRLHRGDPMAKREKVVPDTVSAIGSLGLDGSTPEQQRRLEFARWLVAPDNPLTARVLVNRLWQYHFGTGLVSTASDFGANGAEPSHPELLDWLAQELMTGGWSIKQLHRQILLSKTWRQDSAANRPALEIDADTRLLWRFAPRRLEAETMRDSILSASGVLDRSMGGPGFSAFEIQMENVRHYFPKKHYGPDDWRRMIYMTKVRQEQDSIFGVFDCPDASQVIPQRTRSTTPLQALNLFNSRFMMQQSKLLADRLAREAGPRLSDQIRLAFQLCYSRNPSPGELRAANKFADEQGTLFFCRAILNSNEFIFIP